MDESPYQRVLLELAALDKAETGLALREILRRAAETLGVGRVNYWSLCSDPAGIQCEEAYELGSAQFGDGVLVLRAEEFPRYFRALREEKLIAAHDACADPRTSEFTASYLRPLAIGAMLDVPVWLGGQLAGVLCHEHVGPPRRWTAAEQDFATSMGQLIATTLEVRGRRLTEESLRRIALERAQLAESEQSAREEIRARDEFMSVASHELYTPLAALRLAVDALRGRSTSEHGSNRDERSLAVIDRSVTRLTHLVTDLLNATRVRANRLELERETVNLGELVRDVCDRFSDLLATTNTELVVECDAEVVGRWDRSRLDQVVTNLVSNAAKFAQGKRIEVSVDRRDGWARLVVRDEGIGIPPERLPHIFERFERAVSTRSYGGLGLGLFIARGIVEAHGGRIAAESVLGRGTTMIVELLLEAPSVSA